MRVHLMFAERDRFPIEECWPELIAAVDEGTDDENPDYYQRVIQQETEKWGRELVAMREFTVDIPEDLIRQAFRPTHVPDANPQHVATKESN